MKQVHIMVLFLVLLGGCSSSSNKQINFSACQKTIENYVIYRDKGSSEQYQSLFTPDAKFTIPALNISLAGSDTITQRQQAALNNFKTTHMITNVRFTPLADDKVNAESYFVLFRKPLNSTQQSMSVFNGKYVDTLVLTDDGCLIEARHVEIFKKDEWL
ncbi:nuclear transport factor 2 family protein (plasmid) [Pseudoalteromonas sp. T1lg65]|uniref:nuclear transport factor 2 family protein n=1 Tax=Pseudoalteromonas sp. T1lg65 TaxID=2077101 RepID=UPI003F799D85